MTEANRHRLVLAVPPVVRRGDEQTWIDIRVSPYELEQLSAELDLLRDGRSSRLNITGERSEFRVYVSLLVDETDWHRVTELDGEHAAVAIPASQLGTLSAHFRKEAATSRNGGWLHFDAQADDKSPFKVDMVWGDVV